MGTPPSEFVKIAKMKDEMEESFNQANRKEFRRRIAIEVLPTILQINSTLNKPADVSDCVEMAWDIADLMMEGE